MMKHFFKTMIIYNKMFRLERSDHPKHLDIQDFHIDLRIIKKTYSTFRSIFLDLAT